jgi:hypothetical protein
LRPSSQKLGADISWSITAMRASLVSRSKMPPKILHAFLDVGELAFQIA